VLSLGSVVFIDQSYSITAGGHECRVWQQQKKQHDF
jgi:hypothetical protein